MFHADGSLNRDKLRNLIFSDSQKRLLLNSIVHPEIHRVIVKRLISYCFQGEQFVLLDLPLLFEAGTMVPFINTVIVVNCPADVQLDRLCVRSGFDRETAQRRIDAQMPLKEKCRRATIIIENVGSVHDLEVTAEQIYRRLRKSKAHWRLRLVATCCVGVFLYLTSRTLYQIIT